MGTASKFVDDLATHHRRRRGLLKAEHRGVYPVDKKEVRSRKRIG